MQPLQRIERCVTHTAVPAKQPQSLHVASNKWVQQHEVARPSKSCPRSLHSRRHSVIDELGHVTKSNHLATEPILVARFGAMLEGSLRYTRVRLIALPTAAVRRPFDSLSK